MTQGEESRWFVTTHWTAVFAAGETSPAAAGEREALCTAYWDPLYAFIRRRGYRPHDAQDLTQAFLARLFAKHAFAGLDPRKGRFRSFLLAAVNNFLADERERALALKRGGGVVVLSWDEEAAEQRMAQDAAFDHTPQKLFDRRWALAVFDQALGRLAKEYEAAGKVPLYGAIQAYLCSEARASDYEAVGKELGMSPAAVRMAVHRLRHRFRENLQALVAATVSTPAEVDEEMHYLLELLSQ